jgi:hypothetical protein
MDRPDRVPEESTGSSTPKKLFLIISPSALFPSFLLQSFFFDPLASSSLGKDSDLLIDF